VEAHEKIISNWVWGRHRDRDFFCVFRRQTFFGPPVAFLVVAGERRDSERRGRHRWAIGTARRNSGALGSAKQDPATRTHRPRSRKAWPPIGSGRFNPPLKEIAMVPRVSLTATAVLALLVNNPAFAQDIRLHVLADGPQIATPSTETIFVREAANAIGVTDPLIGYWLMQPMITPDRCEGRLSKFVLMTTEPIASLLQRSGEWTGQWIGSTANVAALAAENAGQWVTTNTGVMVVAIQDTGRWVASRSAEFAVMARDAGQWITVNTDSAVRGAGEWISVSSNAAASSLDAAASAFSGEWIAVEDWSESVMKEVERRLRANDAGEFSTLLKESGFVLTNINIGVGLIPKLDVAFKHERTLSAEEMDAFRKKTEEYSKKSNGIVGFIEATLLKKLLKAGEYSGAARISEIKIDLFPLPDLEVSFDPLRFQEDQEKMLVEAYDFSQSGAQDLKSLHERLLKIEAHLSQSDGKN
jgi:hypothetical protein